MTKTIQPRLTPEYCKVKPRELQFWPNRTNMIQDKVMSDVTRAMHKMSNGHVCEHIYNRKGQAYLKFVKVDGQLRIFTYTNNKTIAGRQIDITRQVFRAIGA